MRAAYSRSRTNYFSSVAPGEALIHAYIDGSSYASSILASWSPAHSLEVIVKSESELSSALEWDQVPRLCIRSQARPRGVWSKDPFLRPFDFNVGTSIKRPHAKFTTVAGGTALTDMFSIELSVSDAGNGFQIERVSSPPLVSSEFRRPELNPLFESEQSNA